MKQDELHLIYQTTFGGTKVFIDKAKQNIVVKKHVFFFPRRQRVIPFSAVYCVRLDYVPGYSGPYGGRPDSWKVSLNIGSENIKIEQTANQNSMWTLAHEISEFIGCRLEDFSEKRDMARLPPPSMR